MNVDEANIIKHNVIENMKDVFIFLSEWAFILFLTIEYSFVSIQEILVNKNAKSFCAYGINACNAINIPNIIINKIIFIT